MMPEELHRLLATGESETLELKRSTAESREIAETAGAFANTRGGTVLVGVTNAGDVAGIQIGADTLESLATTIRQVTDPPLFPSITTVEVEGRTAIVVRVEENPLKPVLVRGRAYRRVGRTNQVLSSSEVANLSMASRALSWDAGPAEGRSLADLNAGAVRRFLTAARRERRLDVDPDTAVENALDKLDLRRGDELTRAAVLLFGREPQRFLRESATQAARFKGNQPLHFLDMKVIEGTLVDQREAIMDFICRHISMEAEIKGMDRVETWEYPLEALREALTNALCHRDYRDPGNIQIRIFDDSLEVWSPGLLPPELSLDDLRRTHRSIPRNRLVANAFFLLGFIEHWGAGTLRMIDLCRDAGLPDPEYEEISGAFVVRFRRSKLTREYLRELGLNDRQVAAVGYIRSRGTMTKREYVRLTHASARTATAELSQLTGTGILVREGSGRSTLYRLSRPQRDQAGNAEPGRD